MPAAFKRLSSSASQWPLQALALDVKFRLTSHLQIVQGELQIHHRDLRARKL